MDYLGDMGLRALEGSLSDVTVRRIFTHTSGLPRYWSHHFESELENRPDVRELVRRYGVLTSPPGGRYIYSNIGIGLARLIIEEISGQNYEDFMQSEVLGPLGLTHTAILTSPYPDEGISQLYSHGRRVPLYGMGFPSAGSVWASAHDLVSFGMFHLRDHLPHQEPVLSDKTIDLTYRSVDSRLPKHNFHLPWIEHEHRGYRVMEFGGHTMGGKVSFRLVPSEDIAVVVVSNGQEADTQRISNWMLNRLLPGFNRVGILRRFPSRICDSGWRAFGGTGDFEGQWAGQTYEGSVPVRLTIDGGEAQLTCAPVQGMIGGSEQPVPARTLRISGNSLHALFPVGIPTAGTLCADRHAIFDLRLDGDRLTGPAYAEESRQYLFYHPSCVRLKRGRPTPGG